MSNGGPANPVWIVPSEELLRNGGTIPVQGGAAVPLTFDGSLEPGQVPQWDGSGFVGVTPVTQNNLGDVISSDADNALELGSDDKLYVAAGGGGGGGFPQHTVATNWTSAKAAFDDLTAEGGALEGLSEEDAPSYGHILISGYQVADSQDKFALRVGRNSYYWSFWDVEAADVVVGDVVTITSVRFAVEPKHYTFIMDSQYDTDPPNVTVLRNDLEEFGIVGHPEPVWTYQDVGKYRCTSSGQFPTEKTLVKIHTGNENSLPLWYGYSVGGDYFDIYVWSQNLVVDFGEQESYINAIPADGVLNGLLVDVEILPQREEIRP